MSEISDLSKLTRAETGKILAAQGKKIEETNKLMFYVIIVLLLMVAGMLLSTMFWLIDSFHSKDRSQKIYNYTVENDPVKETKKDKEIQDLKKEVDTLKEQLQTNKKQNSTICKKLGTSC